MKKRRKGTGLVLLEGRFASKHSWMHRTFVGRHEYIIEGLSVEEAIKLYQETKDDKYVAHVFFSNLGYFLNTIVATMALYGEDFHYTEVGDYVCYAYEAVRYAMARFDFNKSTKIMSYLAGSVFMAVRRFVRDTECKWWCEYNFSEQDEHSEESYNAGVEYYKKLSEEEYEKLKNAYDVSAILQDLFDRYKESLSKLDINSVDEMYRIFGEWKRFNNSQKQLLKTLRKEFRQYLLEKYKDFLD